MDIDKIKAKIAALEDAIMALPIDWATATDPKTKSKLESIYKKDYNRLKKRLDKARMLYMTYWVEISIGNGDFNLSWEMTEDGTLLAPFSKLSEAAKLITMMDSYEGVKFDATEERITYYNICADYEDYIDYVSDNHLNFDEYSFIEVSCDDMKGFCKAFKIDTNLITAESRITLIDRVIAKLEETKSEINTYLTDLQGGL